MLKIISFGYGHPDGPPPAQITLDVRNLFRDPNLDPALRCLTGLDQPVINNVLRQPGAVAVAIHLAELIQTISRASTVDVYVAIGCQGGRHRSPALTDFVASYLVARSVFPTVVHRDVHRDVMPSTSRH